MRPPRAHAQPFGPPPPSRSEQESEPAREKRKGGREKKEGREEKGKKGREGGGEGRGGEIEAPVARFVRGIFSNHLI